MTMSIGATVPASDIADNLNIGNWYLSHTKVPAGIRGSARPARARARTRAVAATAAGSLGVSVGKTNYWVRVLVEMGLLKAENFCRSRNRLA